MMAKCVLEAHTASQSPGDVPQRSIDAAPSSDAFDECRGQRCPRTQLLHQMVDEGQQVGLVDLLGPTFAPTPPQPSC